MSKMNWVRVAKETKARNSGSEHVATNTSVGGPYSSSRTTVLVEKAPKRRSDHSAAKTNQTKGAPEPDKPALREKYKSEIRDRLEVIRQAKAIISQSKKRITALNNLLAELKRGGN
jgi:hypothetical protein